MTTHTTQSPPAADPRPAWFAALDRVSGLVRAVPADRPADPTPCDGFDVRTLMAHLVTTLRRPAAMAAGTDPMAAPLVSEDVLDDPAAAYVREASALRAAWSGPAGDALLDRVHRLPFGEVPARVALAVYVNETLVHGWDLAVATGQDPEGDPEPATAALRTAQSFLPADRRGGPVPFGPVVEPRPQAGPTERLANWSGRESAGWVGGPPRRRGSPSCTATPAPRHRAQATGAISQAAR
ncbi:TIGR03086 family metal-binding protein [Pseudonocardia sp. ICBG1293]|uniref:TIGR03086 family metal-binding protein n=1 Tax=Pseudonocardia sp. ICBG1293 TaxID=2844382 RepID=UPI001CCCEBD6|nr:TIGR03086 family metal-binding protein [Pseudonocardia sp. ICBG1293]